MRIDVKKFLFIGPKGDKERFFMEAQKIGIVEFINPKSKRHPVLPKEAEEYARAIKILRGYVQVEQDTKRDLELASKIVKEVLVAKQTIDKANEEIRKLNQEIARTAPFGEFSLEEIARIEKETKRKIRFYVAKTNKHLEATNDSLIPIHSQDGLDYFMAITEEPIKAPDLIEEHLTESLSDLKKRCNDQQLLINTKEDELKALTRYNWLMHYAFVQEANKVSFEHANETADLLLDDSIFTVEGWVPKSKIAFLEQTFTSLGIFFEEVLIEPQETIPTYLENKGMHRVGEDLVHIFDVPSHKDKDPSIWLLSAFSLFFAMIVGDAGYGLIFFLAALFARYKIKNLKGAGKRFVTLVTVLGVACIVWGFLVNSFFGVSFSEGTAIKQYSLIQWLVEKKAAYHLAHHDAVYTYWVKRFPDIAKSTSGADFITYGNVGHLMNNPGSKFADTILFELALFIGSIHVILGMARYGLRNPTNFGWIAFVIGSYLYLPKYLDASSIIHFVFGVDKTKGAEFGMQLLCAGAALAIVIALFKNGLTGIFEALVSIQLLSDILSYLRIYALGLAGSIVSATINDLAFGLPLFIAIIMVIFAHTVNIMLSVMGGVIHGLRLNFLEWYHYSFEGGGKQFKPLELHVFD